MLLQDLSVAREALTLAHRIEAARARVAVIAQAVEFRAVFESYDGDDWDEVDLELPDDMRTTLLARAEAEAVALELELKALGFEPPCPSPDPAPDEVEAADQYEDA